MKPIDSSFEYYYDGDDDDDDDVLLLSGGIQQFSCVQYLRYKAHVTII